MARDWLTGTFVQERSGERGGGEKKTGKGQDGENEKPPGLDEGLRSKR